MQFESPLIKGTLIQRYKRFLADVRLESGEVITAYCANPGAMLTLKAPGSVVWLSPIPAHLLRKLDYEWQLVHIQDYLVGINTALPNILVEEALQNKCISELADYPHWRREVKYGRNSRIDFLLEGADLPLFYLEVKNVNHMEDETALFPDAVTARGAKHLQELIEVVQAGHRAAVLYVVQRQDCKSFNLARHIDPIYADMAKKAKAAGVEFFCYSCDITLESIMIKKPLPQDEL